MFLYTVLFQSGIKNIIFRRNPSFLSAFDSTRLMKAQGIKKCTALKGSHLQPVGRGTNQRPFFLYIKHTRPGSFTPSDSICWRIHSCKCLCFAEVRRQGEAGAQWRLSFCSEQAVLLTRCSYYCKYITCDEPREQFSWLCTEKVSAWHWIQNIFMTRQKSPSAITGDDFQVRHFQ